MKFDRLMNKLIYGDFIPDVSWKTINRMAYIGYGLITLGIGTVIFTLLQM